MLFKEKTFILIILYIIFLSSLLSNNHFLGGNTGIFYEKTEASESEYEFFWDPG